MKSIRFSLLSMLSAIAAIAVGCAALLRPTWLWVTLVSAAVSAALIYALPAAFYARGARRAFWAWFALIGWGYLTAEHFEATRQWPTTSVSERLQNILQPESWAKYPGLGSPRFLANEAEISAFKEIAQWVWTLLSGLLVGWVARGLYFRQEAGGDNSPQTADGK